MSLYEDDTTTVEENWAWLIYDTIYDPDNESTIHKKIQT